MTYTFNNLVVAGEQAAISANDVANLVHSQFHGEIAARAFDLDPRYASDTLTAAGLHVCPAHDLGKIEAWAGEGETTWVVARHDTPSTDLVNETPQAHTDHTEIGAVGTLLALAGIDPALAFVSRADIARALGESVSASEAARLRDEVWFKDPQLVREMRKRALAVISNRELAVAAATERPLLGLDSTLAMGPAGEALDVVGPATIRALTQFYARYSEISEAEKLVADPNSYARRVGSGAGLGIGALALGLRGRLQPLAQVLSETLGLEQAIASCDLVIGIIDTLHPQTIADSPIRVLGEFAAEAAAPVIVFTHETSLSNHELSEWGIHQAYVVRRDQVESDVARILSGTWVRKR